MNKSAKVMIVTVFTAVFLLFSYQQIEIENLKSQSIPAPQPTISPQTTFPSNTFTTMPNTNTTTPHSNSVIEVGYAEDYRQELSNGKTKVTLTVTAEYKEGADVTLNFSQFYLALYLFRILPLYDGASYPQNSGSVTIGSSHPTADFQLIFDFPTSGFNGMDPAKTYYQLQYTGSATINWTNTDYY